MCTNSCQKKRLPNSAFHGCTSVTWPLTTRNPPGWFIHALTAITKNDPVSPAIATGTAVRLCIRGDSRSQPYTYSAMKIASVKNENPSSANASPNTSP